uniref:Uncharacterized protein n=1 Tax=Zea mays TaxID=4577 RepID=B8A1F7_MAIZE|nr:unknown [Zea mays]
MLTTFAKHSWHSISFTWLVPMGEACLLLPIQPKHKCPRQGSPIHKHRTRTRCPSSSSSLIALD